MPRGSPTVDYNETPRSIGRASRAGVMWATARSYLTELVLLPSAVILAQLLSPFDFGVAAVAMFFGRLAARVSNAGMGNALIRVKVLRDEHVSSIFVVNMMITMTAAAILLASARPIAAFYETPQIASLIPIVALDFVFSALSMVSQALLSRAMRYKEMAALASADLITAAIASVLFAWFGYGYWSLVLGAVCGSGLKWIWGVWLVGWQMSFKFVPSAARELLSFAFGTYAKGLLEYVSLTIDNLIVGSVLGVTALGIYDKAFASAQRAYNKLTVGGPGVAFRALAIIQDDPPRFQRAFEKIVVSTTILTYGVFAVIGAMGPHLIVFLFGEKWQPSVVPFQLLCAGGALRTANAFAGAAANARGWIWLNVWCQAAYVAMIAVGVYVAARWGINGASVAVLAATAVMSVLTTWMVRLATDLKWRQLLVPHWPGVLLAALLGGLVWSVDHAFIRWGITAHFPVLVAQGIVAGLAGLAALRWTPFPIVATVVHEVVSDFSPKIASLLLSNSNGEHVTKSKPAKDRTPPASPVADKG
jgi:O-antigen/teichoic acid export membrane protein